MSEFEIYDVWKINYELKQLGVFLEVMEKSISMYEDQLETKYSIADLENVDGNHALEMEHEAYLDEFSSVLFTIPRRLYMSFIVSWYSFIEEYLLKLCTSVGIFNYDEAESFINSGIKIARNAIHANTNLKSDNLIWDELEDIRFVRNNIVHKNGVIPFNKNKGKHSVFLDDHPLNLSSHQLSYLNDHELIKSNFDFCFIDPSKNYCLHLLEYGNRIFDAIFYEFNLRSFPEM